MTQARTVLVAGATGAVGRRLLDRLLERADTRVTTVGRRAPAQRHARLQHITATLEAMPAALAEGSWAEAHCCLGTTRRAAGSAAAFRAVDLDGVVAFAAAARAGGAQFFGMVSAAGADPRSRNFYLRTKGEAEIAVEEMGFPSLVILQPGLLRGSRAEFRLGERLGQLAAPAADRLLVGSLARYRSVRIDAVAAALEVAGRQRHPGLTRLAPSAIESLAGR